MNSAPHIPEVEHSTTQLALRHYGAKQNWLHLHPRETECLYMCTVHSYKPCLSHY